MQYILTQSEYDALTSVKRLQERNDALEIARQIIVRLAGEDCEKGYCDHCPISDIGHNSDGTMDHNRPSHKESKHICIKNRQYSK